MQNKMMTLTEAENKLQSYTDSISFYRDLNGMDNEMIQMFQLYIDDIYHLGRSKQFVKKYGDQTQYWSHVFVSEGQYAN